MYELGSGSESLAWNFIYIFKTWLSINYTFPNLNKILCSAPSLRFQASHYRNGFFIQCLKAVASDKTITITWSNGNEAVATQRITLLHNIIGNKEIRNTYIHKLTSVSVCCGRTLSDGPPINKALASTWFLSILKESMMIVPLKCPWSIYITHNGCYT